MFSVTLERLRPPSGRRMMLRSESTPSRTFSLNGSVRSEATVVAIGRSMNSTREPTERAASIALTISVPGGEPVISPANLSSSIMARKDTPPARPRALSGCWRAASLASSSSSATTSGLRRRIVSLANVALFGSTWIVPTRLRRSPTFSIADESWTSLNCSLQSL